MMYGNHFRTSFCLRVYATKNQLWHRGEFVLVVNKTLIVNICRVEEFSSIVHTRQAIPSIKVLHTFV